MKEKLRQLLAQRPRTVDYRWATQDNLPPISAAVLVPLFQKSSEYHILFTVRTQTVEHHKGQISFPGGAYHPGDKNLLATALREAFEEVGLWPREVEVVGELDGLVTRSNFLVTPFVGFIPYPYPFRVSQEEVAEILQVPLSHLLDRSHQREEKLTSGHVEYYFDYGAYTIWGVTGHILKPFLGLIEKEGLL